MAALHLSQPHAKKTQPTNRAAPQIAYNSIYIYIIFFCKKVGKAHSVPLGSSRPLVHVSELVFSLSLAKGAQREKEKESGSVVPSYQFFEKIIFRNPPSLHKSHSPPNSCFPQQTPPNLIPINLPFTYFSRVGLHLARIFFGLKKRWNLEEGRERGGNRLWKEYMKKEKK